MKRKIVTLLFTALLLITIFSMVGCSDNGEATQKDPSIVSVAIDASTISEKIYIGQFDASEIKLIVTYSNQTTSNVVLTNDMITEESKAKLSKQGTHIITVIYANHTAKFNVSVFSVAPVYYTLKLYGGLPTAVNDVKLVGVKETSPGYYENSFKAGDKVTIKWVDDGLYFDYWTSNDAQISNNSIYEVTMDGNYTYRAYTRAIVNTVSFITYCNSSIAPNATNTIYESDIETIYKDKYVFLGWTTDVITEEQANNAYSKNRVTFPYDVTRDTEFYAVWTPIGLDYSKNEGGLKIIGFNGNLTELVIPSTVEGKTVNAIGATAFASTAAAKLISITIPSSVTAIDGGAFKNCAHLKIINVDSASSSFCVENNAIYNFDKTELIAYPSARLATTFEVSSNLTTVRDYAFYNASLGAVILKSKVTKIGAHAFDSVHIDYVDFSNVNPIGLTIGNNAFNEYLSKLYITEAMVNTYCNSFSQINSLRDRIITSEDELTALEIFDRTETDGNTVSILCKIIQNDNFLNKGETAEIIAISRNIVSSTVPLKTPSDKIITSIGYYAYKDCESLTQVVIPFSSNLERICDGAFDGTPWIKTVSGDSIIANATLFKYFGNATTYNLGVNIKNIAEGAFSGNTQLKYVNIGENTALESISAYAFYECQAFVGFICPANPNGDGLYFKGGITSVGAYAFYHTAITAVKLQAASNVSDNKWNYIGEFAFSQCHYLKSVEIASATETIATTAFIGSDSLEKFVLEEKNADFVVIDGILYKKLDNGYMLFNYPAARIDGVFRPDTLKNYVNAITIDESEYLSNKEVVGEVKVCGSSYNLYMKLTIDESLVEIKNGDKKLKLKNSSAYLTETTQVTCIDNGEPIYDGQKYYYFLIDDNVQVLFYDAQIGSYYYETMLEVKGIGEYALYNSNIAALYVPKTLTDIDKLAMEIPGLVYVEFEDEPVSTYLTMFKHYEPKFVIIHKGSSATYFSNDTKKRDEKLFTATDVKPEFFYGYNDSSKSYDKNILYSVSSVGAVEIVRTSRTQKAIVIPETVFRNTNGTITEYTAAKIVVGYAFFGYYLEKTTLRKVSELMSNAFTNVPNMMQLYIETMFISDVQTDTFGPALNNGLYIYDYRNDINLYMTTPNWNLVFFTYENTEGVTENASKYLILSQDGAFAAITYDIGDGIVTLAVPYGTISDLQIEQMRQNITKVGYDIAYFVNDNGVTISIEDDYVIPYNQVLTCEWKPKQYTLLLTAMSGVTLDLELYETNSIDGSITYKAVVTYDEQYDFPILTNTSNKILHWRNEDGTLCVANSGKWTYDTEDTIELQLIYAYKINYSLLNENATLDVTESYVYYNYKYVLAVPTTTDEKIFEGWSISLGETEKPLTGSDGQGLSEWNYNTKNIYNVYAVWGSND